jgi:dihydrofolate reductase
MKLILLMAQTLDGKTGKSANHFPGWTGSADKRLFARLSRQAGVVIMGSRTFDTIGTPLPHRKNVVLTRNRSRRSEWPNLVYSHATPQEILADLDADGFSEAILAGGTLINSLFAAEGLIDEIIVTISPLIFGQGLSLFSQEIAMSLELETVEQIDAQRVCLKYRVPKGNRPPVV